MTRARTASFGLSGFGLAGAVAALLLAAVAGLAADTVPPQVANPVGKWDDYTMIIQADMPLRGTLRQVFIDKVSEAEARRSGTLPYGTTIVMRDYIGDGDGHGGWKAEDNRLLRGHPTVILVQQKQKGWGTSHPAEVRIGEWEFALYTPDGKPITVNFERACMPCHKAVEATDYTFLVANFFADRLRR